VLNVLDVLAGGDTRFVEIRKHRPEHRTLTRVEKESDVKKREVAEAREKFEKQYLESEKKLRDAVQKKIDEVRNRKGEMDQLQMATEVALVTQTEQDRLEQELEAKRRDRDKLIKKSETDLKRTKQEIQDGYKIWAVLLPPIPPLLIGIVVFLTRRSREREGVDRARLR
jgi:ABC-2 type transport system permease protein